MRQKGGMEKRGRREARKQTKGGRRERRSERGESFMSPVSLKGLPFMWALSYSVCSHSICSARNKDITLLVQGGQHRVREHVYCQYVCVWERGKCSKLMLTWAQNTYSGVMCVEQTFFWASYSYATTLQKLQIQLVLIVSTNYCLPKHSLNSVFSMFHFSPLENIYSSQPQHGSHLGLWLETT